jgi:Zn-dependent protease
MIETSSSGGIQVHLVRWLFPFINGLGLGVLAMLLHEWGHIAAALVLGVPVKSVGIRWNKGLYTVREAGTVQQNALIAAAGPFVNFLLIATEPWFPLFSMANFCYALANLLPIEGSDGFRIAGCWQQMRARNDAR